MNLSRRHVGNRRTGKLLLKRSTSKYDVLYRKKVRSRALLATKNLMVKVVICPTVHVPDAARGKQAHKRTRGDMGWNEEASSYRVSGNNSSSRSGSSSSSSSSGADNKRRRFNEQDSDSHELNALFSSVKDLSATALAGQKKKAHKEDKLTKLGALPGASALLNPRFSLSVCPHLNVLFPPSPVRLSVPQQRMPFKMKMGIMAGRARRDEKEVQVRP